MNTKIALVLVTFLIGSSNLFADAPSQFDQTHRVWDSWLKKYVKVSGPVSTVDYKAAKESPDLLKGYLNEVTIVTKQQYDGFNDNQKLAYLINAYNAWTVQLILDNYPVKSIKDVGSLFKSAWKKKFFKLFGEEQHLDGIEHGIIRENFQEPRIHFAVVCASIGCPQLRNEAFLATKLEQQLEDGAKSFLGDTSRNKFDAAEKKLHLSMIFKWYGDDFKKKKGSVQEFVASYMGKTAEEKKVITTADLDFLNYDWSLNETK